MPPSHAELMFLQLLASPGLYWQEKPQTLSPVLLHWKLCSSWHSGADRRAQTLGVQLSPSSSCMRVAAPMQGSRHLPGLLPLLAEAVLTACAAGCMIPWASQRQLLPCLACVPTAPAFCSTSDPRAFFREPARTRAQLVPGLTVQDLRGVSGRSEGRKPIQLGSRKSTPTLGLP